MCRREGIKLYLKGSRCESEKCAITKRHTAPGQHGNSRKRVSEYGEQLREKQKAKRIYGILEKQFKNYVNKALKTKGITGEALIQELETRLDNMVYRSGLAVSRAQARQMIRSGVFAVNGMVKTIPSEQVKPGDILTALDFSKVHLREAFALPEWLDANVKEKSVKLVKMPSIEDLTEDINVQLIIEFYSR